ncbi:MAG: Sjogren's syndrome/scleroderma autoantigen 1 family protein [Nitrososphaerales archaeon]
MAEVKKNKMGDAAELIRRGAILLKETCPKCGGLQVRYKKRSLCVNCDDLSDFVSIERASLEVGLPASLGDIALDKIQRLSDALSKEEDVEKQASIARLILIYMEIIEKMKKAR